MKLVVSTVLLCAAFACSSSRMETPIDAGSSVRAHVDAIADQVQAWSEASAFDEASSAAEAAANLVVGPEGPGYGDRNGDGSVDGESDRGLLPGLDGEPLGVVLDELGDAACVERDVLGGSWDDPRSHWSEMVDAIAAWAPSNNTMPSLPSHPMRIVGWATFTIGSGDLDLAHTYAGHAQLHVDVTEAALAACS